ncbi:MAG: DUF2911 domain-containing protein [Gemmatimonadota bacterium]
MNRANLSPSLLGGVVASALTAVFLFAPPAQANPSTAAFSPDDPECTPAGTMDVEGRASPYDSVTAAMGEARVKVCYGRPSARGRTMIGGENVPFGQFWRTGANEPTTLHVTAPVEIAGIALEPGSYSLYTRPGETTWEVFLNTSVDRWGVPINEEVRSHEVGSAELPRERPESHVETMTFTVEDVSDDSANLVLEWETFRISIPIRAR